MIEFFKGLENAFQQKADHIALGGEDAPQGYTYGELDENSGRIYRGLKERGIGKEDIVLVCLPRSTRVFTAMLGVWKAGAAFVICEDSMPPERIAFIRADSGCKLFLDLAVWEEMMSQPTLPGREIVDAHDLAYIVYTSGSTGTPKGVMHEFGELDSSVRSKQINGEAVCCETDVIAINSPLNFVPGTDFFINAMYHGATLQLIPTDVVKNLPELIQLYDEAGVTVTFMTPSLYRSIERFNPQLRLLSLGGEGCSDVYNDRIRLLNGYNLSEAGREICLFEIDRAYDVAPIGKNQGGEELHLLKEDGTEAAVGELGEICFANPYMRGYINQPEKTAEALRGGLFHSGDLAIRDENGNLTIRGRMDDMVKINGNRVDPSEIEAATKDIMHLSWCAAKAFVEDNRSFICFYYTDALTLDEECIRGELMKRLPDYMIPSYYICLDSVPTLATGKTDRRALPKPDTSDFMAEYVAPVTETQKILCNAIAKALNLERVGIKDDFYKLGGDSLSSVEALAYADLPELLVSDVFIGRTVEKITELYERREKATRSFADLECNARKHDWPLTNFQLECIDSQLFSPHSGMLNQRFIYRIPKDKVDPGRFCAAVNRVIDTYTVFSSVILFNDDNELVWRYVPEMRKYVAIEEMTDEEFKKQEPEFNKPYHIFNEVLYDFHVIVSESSVYFLNQAHHLMTDGRALNLIAERIIMAYRGEELPPDTYFTCLEQRVAAVNSERYEQAKKYHEETYLNKKWWTQFELDGHPRDNITELLLDILPITQEQLTAAEKRHHVTRAIISYSALLLAFAKLSGNRNILFSWIYDARESELSNYAIGCLCRYLPVGIEFDKLTTVGDLCRELKKKCNESIAYSGYDWRREFTNAYESEILDVVYESDLISVGKMGELGAESYMGIRGPEGLSHNMAAGFNELPTGMLRGLAYRRGCFSPESMKTLGSTVTSFLNTLILDENSDNILLDDLLKD